MINDQTINSKDITISETIRFLEEDNVRLLMVIEANKRAMAALMSLHSEATVQGSFTYSVQPPAKGDHIITTQRATPRLPWPDGVDMPKHGEVITAADPRWFDVNMFLGLTGNVVAVEWDEKGNHKYTMED